MSWDGEMPIGEDAREPLHPLMVCRTCSEWAVCPCGCGYGYCRIAEEPTFEDEGDAECWTL